MGPIRVLIAARQALFGELLANALNQLPRVQVVARTAEGRRLMELVLEYRPDVVVVDRRLPPLDSLEVTRTIRRQAPGTKVMILGGAQDRTFLLESVRAGVDGYLLKSGTVAELYTALQTVVAGASYFSATVSPPPVQPLANILDSTGASNHHRLSVRERQILEALVNGTSTSEIAQESGISGKTVRNHISHMYQKLGVSNRAGLLLYAFRSGIAPSG
jgi:DNA-binding NarL/FixJ family response regulator